MQPELDLGPLTLQTFGICFGLGVPRGRARAREAPAGARPPPDWAYEIIFAGLIGGLIGARIDYLLQNWDTVSDDLLGSLFSGSRPRVARRR